MTIIEERGILIQAQITQASNAKCYLVIVRTVAKKVHCLLLAFAASGIYIPVVN